jgi:transposase
MILEPTRYSRIIGVDVASTKLDVHDSQGKLKKIVINDELEIAKAIASKIRNPTETLVVCEGTGGYEDHLVDVMHDYGVNVAVVNPRQVRDFAKGHGLLEKTDKIDAAIIAKFGKDVRVNLATPPTPEEKHFRAIFRRRMQLVSMVQQEKNRLGQGADNFVRELIEASVTSINTELKLINKKIEELLHEQSKTDSRIANWLSVEGVGVVTVAMLVCELREIGKLSRGGIAKLVGVAPMANQSGKGDKKRYVRGGRTKARCILYMAALSASQHNPRLKTFYQRLLKKGKPKKLALIAVARKLLTILNDMARYDRAWDPNFSHQSAAKTKNAAAPLSLN